MNRYHIVSTLFHFAIIAAVLLMTRKTFNPIPKFEVYKVSIAPLPQPKIIDVEEPVQEEVKQEIKEQKEKAPPPQKTKPKKIKKTTEKLEKKVKKGLPDIKPKVYTGSGRGFTYSYYLNILLNKINKNWQNPFKGKDIVLKSIVYFEVDKNGKIYNVRLEENSGDEVYNETTIRAVTLTKRLPPLPKEFSDDYLKVHLEFLTAQ
jgi:TonB family protein